MEAFLAKHASDARTLDIGSGGSSYGRYFPNRFTVDIDPARNPEMVADAHALPFPDNEFARVLCTEVLEHTREPRQVAKELMRVLKPGGMLVLTTRFAYPLHDAPGDYFRFTRYGLQELFSSWSIVEIRSELGDFATIAALLQRIGFQTRLRAGRLSKALLYAAVWVFSKLDSLILDEYGDIKKSAKETGILSTGVYIAVRK